MKIINQYSNIWGQTPTDKQESILWIEKAGRVCYKSFDKIVKGSGKKFVGNIWNHGHFSVLEQSNIVLRSKEVSKYPADLLRTKLSFDSKFLSCCVYHDRIYIAGNWRAWIEYFNKCSCKPLMNLDNIFNILDNSDELELVYNKEDIPTQLKNITVEFVTDRAVTHELVRHRPASYSQESQRYVRYGEIEFIHPSWIVKSNDVNRQIFYNSCLAIEEDYNDLLNTGMKAEDARVILPNCTATRIVMTASIPEWEHIFNLRLSKAAYPQIRNLLKPVKDEFVDNGWINENNKGVNI